LVCPGESYLAVLDGFHVHADRIRFVINRQEGGAAFMAEAQGKLTGRPGVCFVTRGPGATNASIGLHTAFQDSTPMVLFVGDVASDARDREAFQEVDYSASSAPAPRAWPSAWNASTTRVASRVRGPRLCHRHERPARTGGAGAAGRHADPAGRRPAAAARGAGAGLERPGRPAELRSLLLSAERPLVLAGGGGWTPQSAAALQRFAENWQLPGGQHLPVPGHL
jgi:acetolactate synthase I/II/III large subunit